MSYLETTYSELQRQTFNRLAKNWDENAEHDSNRIRSILEITNLGVGERILDLAGGTGVLIPYLLEFQPKEILLLDISEKMLERARLKFGEEENIKFSNIDFYDFNDHPFDYIICFNAFPHFIDKNVFATKLSQLTKPNGRFVLCHDQSRKRINERHQNASPLSNELKGALEEAKRFEKNFNIDVLVDTDKTYIISGVNM